MPIFFSKTCCEIDQNINLELVNKPSNYFSFCIGQESIDKCKNEIKNKDLFIEWICIRNIITFREKYYGHHPFFYIGISEVYITDNQIDYIVLQL